MKKLLVATDFSPAAHAAAKYAASLAKAFDAELYLLHVFMEMVPSGGSSSVWILTGSTLQEQKSARVTEEVRLLRKNYDIRVTGEAKMGYPAQMIHQTAAQMSADLVVIGTAKRAASEIFGNTMLTTERKAEVPVLVVPEHAQLLPLKHVVLALDFQRVNNFKGFEFLFQLVDRLGACLKVLHIGDKRREDEAQVRHMKEQLTSVFSKISFWYDEVEAREADDAIVHYVHTHPADMLVLLAHRHSRWERLLGHIHTRSLSVTSELPVLIIPDK